MRHNLHKSDFLNNNKVKSICSDKEIIHMLTSETTSYCKASLQLSEWKTPERILVFQEHEVTENNMVPVGLLVSIYPEKY